MNTYFVSRAILLTVILVGCAKGLSMITAYNEKHDSTLRRGDRVLIKNEKFVPAVKVYFIASVATTSANAAFVLVEVCYERECYSDVRIKDLNSLEKVIE
jgi:hypothetical protein